MNTEEADDLAVECDLCGYDVITVSWDRDKYQEKKKVFH